MYVGIGGAVDVDACVVGDDVYGVDGGDGVAGVTVVGVGVDGDVGVGAIGGVYEDADIGGDGVVVVDGVVGGG